MKDILKVFPNYVQLFQQVEREYQLTPSWRMIRSFSLLNRMHQINKFYAEWLQKTAQTSERTSDRAQASPKGASLNKTGDDSE